MENLGDRAHLFQTHHFGQYKVIHNQRARSMLCKWLTIGQTGGTLETGKKTSIMKTFFKSNKLIVSTYYTRQVQANNK